MPHRFDPTILREYDIRGIVGQTLAVEDALALGRAFGTMVRRAGGERVMLGYDGRLSSPELAASVSDGLVSTGCEVLAIGRGPTPMLYYSVYELNADAGIMVTGSHNPPDYNGFKMMLKSGPVYGEAIADLGRIAAEGAYAHGSGKAGRVDIFERYVDRLMQNFSGAALDVAWDPGNGAAGEVTEALAQRLPGRHLVINGAIDGSFPNHHPDPTVEANLAQLKEVVRTQNLDLGIAFDGDGDRIGAVDSQGRVVWGDQLLAILARDVIAQLPGATIIADVKASQVLFDEIEKAGGTPLMWKTGHSLIKSKMAEVGSPLAGEMSGHIFFKHDYYGFDDALYAAVRLIASVSHQGGDLAALRDALPDAVNTPEMRFDCPEERKRAVVAEVRARLEQDGAEVNAIDGVRVTTQDGWWLLRPSNTQAVLVARCEAKDQAGLDRLMALLRDQLDRSGIALPAA